MLYNEHWVSPIKYASENDNITRRVKKKHSKFIPNQKKNIKIFSIMSQS